MIKISVITPVYNAERYLRRCLDSVLSQTLRDIEVICVDDGSTDASPDILAEYAKDDCRIRIIHQQNAGQGAARNSGVAVATGEYVYFIDADDALADADAFSRLYDTMSQQRLNLLFFDAVTRFEDGADSDSAAGIGSYSRKLSYSGIMSGSEIFVAMNRNREFFVSPCLYMIRRDALLSAGILFKEGILHEDDIFTLSLILSINFVSHRNWALYERWVHPGSTMTAGSVARHLQGCLACCEWVEEQLRRKELARCVRRELKRCRIGYRHAIRVLTRKAGLPDAVDYPFSEKLANLVRCLRDRGIGYTLLRIFTGRRCK